MRKSRTWIFPAIAAGLAASAWSTPAAAWGDTGHRTVCEIALRNLTATASVEVARLLQANPTIRGANARNTDYGWACTYPDHSAAGAPPGLARRGAEHFVNYPRTTLSVDAATGCGAAAQCIIWAIRTDYDLLRSAAASDAQRAAALVYLGHWFGDIHQPLHSSFRDDQGGNEMNVAGLCTSNLHSTWDTCILQARTTGTNPSIDSVRTLAASWSALATDVERAQWLSSMPWQWSAESYAVTLAPETGYCLMIQSACNYSATQATWAQGQPRRSVAVDAAYMDWSMPIIRRRITQAGIRLAHRLNLALDPAYRG